MCRLPWLPNLCLHKERFWNDIPLTSRDDAEWFGSQHRAWNLGMHVLDISEAMAKFLVALRKVPVVKLDQRAMRILSRAFGALPWVQKVGLSILEGLTLVWSRCWSLGDICRNAGFWLGLHFKDDWFQVTLVLRKGPWHLWDQIEPWKGLPVLPGGFPGSWS